MLIVPNRVDQGHELRFNPPLGQRQIDSRKHLGRPRFDGRVRTKNPTYQCRIDCSRSTLAADIADNQAEPGHGVGNEIVQVAADSPRRNKFRGNIKMGELRASLLQQPHLQLASQRQIALQSPFLPRNLLVELGILNRDGNLCRQRRDRPLVLFCEESAAGMLQIKHPNYFVFVDQRHRQLRSRLRIGRDIARIFAHIGHQHCLF